MHSNRVRGVAVMLLVSVLLAGLPTRAAPAAPTSAPSNAPHGLAGIQPPTLTATVTFAVDLTTGVELYEQNADIPVPPASTMKIVTALLARQMLTLDDQVTVED